MKVAGRKNDGAWYRTNVWLKAQQDAFRTRLKADTELLQAATIMYGIMGNLAGTNSLQTSGIAEIPASAALMLAGWIDGGFPRQVYSGTLSWDRYIKVNVGDTFPPPSTRVNNKAVPVYTPQNAENMRQVGTLIRTKLNRHRMVQRQLNDIPNTNVNAHQNPGGVANAQKNSLDGQ